MCGSSDLRHPAIDRRPPPARSSLAIRTELARPWPPVSDAVELTALRELGGRLRVQVAGIMRTDELLAGLVRLPVLRVLRVNPRLPRVRNVPERITITA
ncbi:hypothetical protein ABZS76_19470 [Streptomyces sp. NPDC005562]|uniref:hypothetical protein n=1 Tax=Streptomyces sp. NPDC005562 TaxID=3154890 RepID=UPI0033A99070